MKLGILEAGPVHADLVDQHGEYVDVFRRFLAPRDSSLAFAKYAVHRDGPPADPMEQDAWLISGSRYGVYEDHSWIEPLKGFIRDCRDAGKPMIGVCFGHQIMAEALGGKAEKSHKGWGLGPHRYEYLGGPSWMTTPANGLTIHALHQDQVTSLPPDSAVIAQSGFCECAAVVYGDPERPYGISIQAHPEFGDDFIGGVIQARSDDLPSDLVSRARADIGVGLDRDWAAEWFLSFLKLSD